MRMVMSYFKYIAVVIFAGIMTVWMFDTCRTFGGNDIKQIDKELHIIPPATGQSFRNTINRYTFNIEKERILIAVGWDRIDGGQHYMGCSVGKDMLGRCILHTKTSYGEFYFRMKKGIKFGFCQDKLCVKEYNNGIPY